MSNEHKLLLKKVIGYVSVFFMVSILGKDSVSALLATMSSMGS